jgi:aminopeptidase N
MENAGAVTIAEEYVFRSRVTDAAYEQRANTVLHELAHMWFGDLLAQLETASGRDLSAWSQEWLETAGCNTLRASFDTGPDGAFTAFSVLQEAPADHPTLRSHRVAIGLYDLVDGKLVRTHREELDVVGAKTEVPALVGRPQPALVLVNDDDLTFAKIRLDEQSLATLVAHVGDFADALPRALCWAAAWDMTRDAEMPTRDYVALVQRGIGGETDIGVVQSLLRQAQSALTLFADPEWAPVGRVALATSAHEAVTRAEPGSDLQLAWVRALASLATTEEHLAFLQGLLAGTADLPGLSVDAELRWHLLHRLVVVGKAGLDAIEAEVTRDPTAAGQRHAAACRAARPVAEAKALAWHDLVETDELPNAVLAAVLSGFAPPEQAQLVAPYVERYFRSIGDVWSGRTAEIAQNLVVGLYPTIQVSPAVVEQTDRYLSDNDVPPALRRLLLEGRDGVVRALRARARDASAR